MNVKLSSSLQILRQKSLRPRNLSLKETQQILLYHCSKQHKNIENLLSIEQSIAVSFCPFLCLLRLVLPSPFSTTDDFQFLDSTLQNLSVTNDHSCRCIKNPVYNNFNSRLFRVFNYYGKSIHIFLKLKLLKNSSVQILLKLDQNLLEIPQPFSEAATGGVPYKKLFLKFLRYSQENKCEHPKIK